MGAPWITRGFFFCLYLVRMLVKEAWADFNKLELVLDNFILQSRA